MKCCEKYTAALSAFADGELNETERDALLEHLEHCEGCREHLSELMILHTMFEELPELEAPQGFSERVLDRMHAEGRAKKRHRRAWPRVLAACFALVLISAAAWKLLPVRGNDCAASDGIGNAEAAPSGIAAAPAPDEDSYSYTYTTVQKDSAQEDEEDKKAGSYSAEAGDRSADTAGDYAIIALDTPDAAEFLSARGMAVYDETEDYVSYLVVPEAARELAELPDVPETERAALREASDLLIVEVAKAAADETAESAEEPGVEEEVNG